MAKLHELVAKGIGNVSLWSSHHAKAVVAVVLAMTLAAGYGVTLITTNVDVADVLPRGNPNTEAAYNLTDRFRSTFTQQVTFQMHVDESGQYWRADNAKLQYRASGYYDDQGNTGSPDGPHQIQANSQNITDEVYIRAMDELKRYIQDRTDFDRVISHSGIYSLINWTIAGGYGDAPPESFGLPTYTTPQGAQDYVAVDQATKAAVLSSVDAISSPSWNHGAMLFMPAADNDANIRDLGDSILQARDDYLAAVEAGETEWTVFGPWNPPLLTVDLPVANSHSSRLVEEDMVKLMPIIAAFIIVFLWVAFRNVRSIVISFTALGVGVTWTYGTMGYMGIALNTLNMTIVPLIMGVGIDYAIHMINEFLEHKAHGQSDDEALQGAGHRAGLAMLIATLTTSLGLIVMMISPSLLMAQLGFLSAVAIIAIYVLTITFIPAALTLVGGTDKMGASFQPSTSMPWLARGVTKTRWLVLPLVGLLTFGAYMASLDLDEEAFGDPGKNFPEDDPVRREHEQGLKYFYEMDDPDVKANILTFEGPGILEPDAIEYMRVIEANLKTKDRVIQDTLRTLPWFVETWLTVKGGPECAGLNLAGQRLPGELDPLLGGYAGSPGPCSDQMAFPATAEALREEVRQVFDSPMQELASIAINYPAMDMAAMTFSVQAFTYDEAEEVWFQVWEAIEEANREFGGSPPEGVYVAFVGNTATNYLFVDEQLPWLNYMSITATIILFILVLVFTNDLKAAVVATGLAGITSIWWLGILPSMGIGLAITLMLPLVFIFNIGTDYAVHIIWSMKQTPSARQVFETTGKAILFSAITTAGAFAVFTMIQNVAVSRTMVATTVAIGIIFTATMMVIPVFYKVLAKGADTKVAAKKEKPLTAVKRAKA